MRFVLLATLAWLTAPVIANDKLVDLPTIIGKTQPEAEKIIGDPAGCNQSKYGLQCTYNLAEMEIVYIDGKADWITVEAMDDSQFEPAAMLRLGLDLGEPSFKSDFILRWEPAGDLLSVSLFKGAQNADYAYVKAVTP